MGELLGKEIERERDIEHYYVIFHLCEREKRNCTNNKI